MNHHHHHTQQQQQQQQKAGEQQLSEPEDMEMEGKMRPPDWVERMDPVFI